MKWLILLGVAAVLALLPLTTELGSVANILILLYLYIMLGESFNILAGYTGLISLGHASFLGIGALATRSLWIAGVSIYIALFAGGLSAVVAALIVGFPSLRLRGAYFAMGTLALTMILYSLTTNIFVATSFLPPKFLASYNILPRYYLALSLCIATVGAVYLLTKSRFGMGMIAMRENEDAAGSLGINTFRCKLISLLISAFIAGLAGGLFAFYQVAYYHWEPFSPIWSFEPILVTFIGGSGTVIGPVIGALFYVGLREVFVLTLGAAHIIIFGSIFILVVLTLRGGLVDGLRRARRFLIKSGESR